MENLPERMVIVTITDQEDLDDSLIGKKVTYLQGKSQGITIPWIEAKLEELAQTSLSTGAFIVTSINNQDKPEQKVTIMVEPCLPPEELIILGGGHIAKPLVQVAKLLGFRVMVIDDRIGFATEERFPEADRVLCKPFEELEDVLDLGPRSYVVIVTQGHRHDWVCMRQVLKYRLAYLGVIGSKRKIALTIEKMLEEGYEPSKINNVYMPIGLDIGAETPEEIAVSIAAELIKVRYGGKAASLKMGDDNLVVKTPEMTAEMQFDLIQKAVTMASHERPAAIATIIATEGSTPRKVGSRMLIQDDRNIYGTIGGGKGEAMVCEEALKIMKSGKPATFKVAMDAGKDDAAGMICGGIIEVFIEPVNMFAQGFEGLRL